VSENIKRIVPFQIRTMRDEREWSQGQAGKAIGKPQNVISRLESLNYGKLSLQTLVEVAQGFDVGLLIKFVPFSRLVKEYEDLSANALSAKSVSDPSEIAKLEAWVSSGAESQVQGIDIVRNLSIVESRTEPGIALQVPQRRPVVLARQATSGGVVKNEQEDAWQKIALNRR
jgi:hypothetical protein